MKSVLILLAMLTPALSGAEIVRGDHGGPVWERFLQEGFVVIVADYRGGDMNSVSSPAPARVTAIDDGIAVIERSVKFVKTGT